MKDNKDKVETIRKLAQEIIELCDHVKVTGELDHEAVHYDSHIIKQTLSSIMLDRMNRKA